MSESFIHYLWQYQYFNKHDLVTSDGEPVSIFHPGYRNTHAGPDFLDVRVRIGDMEWIGSVEIHIDASGWIHHRHDHDAAYDNVVLHVVWNNDKAVTRTDGSVLPALELKQRVEPDLLQRYKKLAGNPEEIPCTPSFRNVTRLTVFSTLDRALTERLERKSKNVFDLLKRNQNNWEETCYQLLARNFGFKVNADPFLQLAQSLPYKFILRHLDKPASVEALVFGQSGFLEENDTTDDYIRVLRREHALLSHKYSLHERQLNRTQWKFLRLRPANFPTIRLAQFASLLQKQKNIVSKILETETYEDLRILFTVRQSDYWQNHYQAGKISRDEIATLGDMSIDNIIVNTIVPMLAAYGKLKDDGAYLERAVTILQHVPAEWNFITRRWATVGIKPVSAFDSQALIELYTNFCSKHRCLDCNIGASLLKPVCK
jgi:hypothetical protein